jgi:hypothetical protein
MKSEDKYFEVSQSQKSTFLIYSYSKENVRPFNISFSINTGAINYDAIKNAFSLLMKHYEIFRTTLLIINGEVKQKVWPYDPSHLKIEIIDLGNSIEKNHIIKNLAIKSEQTNFKPDKCPWLNVKLVRLEKNKHILLISIPHMISDGCSVKFIKNELSQLYKSCVKGETSDPPCVLQYKDYISEINEILKSERGEKHRKYWMNILKKLPSITLTSVYSTTKPNISHSYRVTMEQEIEECCIKLSPRSASTFMGVVSFIKFSQGCTYVFYIDPRRLINLKELAEEAHVSLSVTLIGTFHLLIFLLIGEKDIVIGINQNLRDTKRLDEVIGFLINTVLLRYELEDSLTLCDYIKTINLCFIKTLRHKIYPFEKALYDSDVPLHRVGTLFLNIVNRGNEIINKCSLEPHQKDDIVYPYFDIDIHADIYSNIIRLECNYKTEIFTISTIKFIYSKYLDLIDSFKINSNLKIADIKFNL